MARKQRLLAFISAAFLVALMAGCGAGGHPDQGGVPELQKVGNLEKTTLNVAVLADVDSAGFYVALNEGLFAQEGLRVNYTPAYTDTIIEAQAKGQYDITGMNYVSYIEAQLRHKADLRIFAEGSLTQPGTDVIMTMPDSKVRSLQNLKGHVLGVNTTAEIGYLLVAATLTQAGIGMKITPAYSPSSVMLPGDPAYPYPATQQLVSGQAAAVVMSEPFITEIEEQYGANVIADLSTGATSDFPILGYATTKAWAQANPNTLKAFDTALEAGQQIADTDRQAVEAALVALPQGKGGVDRRTAALLTLSYYPLGVTPVRLQRVADIMQEFGFLRQRFDIRQLLN